MAFSAALALGAASAVPSGIVPAAGASSTATQAGALIKLLLKKSGDGDDAVGEQQAQGGGLGEQQAGLPAGVWDFGPHASVRVSSSGEAIVIAVVALLLCCWMCWCCKGCAAIREQPQHAKGKEIRANAKEGRLHASHIG